MNIKALTLFIGALALLMCSSCSKEPCCDNGYGSNPVSFGANIQPSELRATDADWEGEDAIGIYAIESGQQMSTTTAVVANNLKYTNANGSRWFEAVERALILPEDGSSLDVVAYYPYTTNIKKNIYKVDLTEQKHPAAIDLMYANNLNSINHRTDRTAINLTFRHQLAKIMVVFEDEKEDIAVTFRGFHTRALFNLANAQLTEPTNIVDIKANVNGATATAIIVPGNAIRSEIVAERAGVIYKRLISARTFPAGTITLFVVKLNEVTGEIDIVNPDGSITDWDDDGGGSLYPEGEVPDNTLEIGSNELDFSWAGGEQLVSLRASDGLSWSARSSDESWLNVSPASGTASGTLKLIATTNTVEAARTATVTISASGSSGALSQTLTVRQAGKTQTGEEETYYLEDFNSFTEKVFLTPTTGEEQTTNINGVDFVATGKLDVRDTKTLDWHLWYAANSDTRLIIKKGNEGHTANKLSFDVAANIFNDSDSFDVANLEVKVGGASFSIPSRVISKPNGDDLSTYVHVELTGLPDSFTEFEINAKAATNKIGVRVDNIKLVGVN